jgi:hypothetical protein
MRYATKLALAAVLTGAMSTPVLAGGDFWRRASYPPYAPPPIHVYELGGGPTWTSNGWSYPPVQVYYPAPLPYPAYAGPSCGVIEHRGIGCRHRPGWFDRRRGW